MNTVKRQIGKRPEDYQNGDILIDDDGILYILARWDGYWIAVSIESGRVAQLPSENPREATKGLKFYARNIEIIVGG